MPTVHINDFLSHSIPTNFLHFYWNYAFQKIKPPSESEKTERKRWLMEYVH